MNNEENSNIFKPLLNEIANSDDYDSFLTLISEPKNRAWEYYEPSDGYSIIQILIFKNLFELSYKVINIIKSITSSENFLKFINHQNYQGISTLHLACFKGNMGLMKLLLENGADYKAKTKIGLSCLHFSAQANKVSAIYYLTNKYNLNLFETDNNGNTFYHWACHCSSEEVVEFYLNDKNFNINLQNKDGFTPFQLYLSTSNTRSIKRLMYRGADVYIRNNKGKNCFDIVKNNKYNNQIQKEKIIDILKRKYYQELPFSFFIFFQFFYVFLIIIFEFPFINTINIRYLQKIYLFWTFFVWIYIIYFLIKSPGTLKQNPKNYLLNLIENDKDNVINLWYYCIKCQTKKGFNCKHCYYCDKCIIGFDHHCFWLKRCIGTNNKLAFFFLIIIILLNSIFNLILCFLSEKNEKIVNNIIFASFLMNHFEAAKICKILIYSIYFLFSLSAFIIIIPLIKFYISNGRINDSLYCQSEFSIINNINDENDENEKLIIKNDDNYI